MLGRSENDQVIILMSVYLELHMIHIGLLYIYIYSLTETFSSGLTILSPRDIDCITRTIITC